MKEILESKGKGASGDEETNLAGNSWDIIEIPQNPRHVMQLYYKCSKLCDKEQFKIRMNCQLDKYSEKGIQSTLVLEETEELIQKQITVEHCVRLFNDFISGTSPFPISYTSHCQSTENLSQELVSKLIKPIRRVYLLEYDKSRKYCKIIVFLNCGYPLLIETKYNVKFRKPKEVATVYSNMVFRNELHGKGQFASETNEELLYAMQDLIISSDISYILREHHLYELEENIKDSLIYGFLQHAFCYQSFEFSTNYGWIFKVKTPKHDDNCNSDDETLL